MSICVTNNHPHRNPPKANEKELVKEPEPAKEVAPVTEPSKPQKSSKKGKKEKKVKHDADNGDSCCSCFGSKKASRITTNEEIETN